jgi:hypothetical protein
MLRGRTQVQVILAGFFTAAIAVTHLTNDIGFWVYLREIIPGAKAIRAPCRIGMLQLLPAAIGVGFFFQWFAQRKRWSWLVVLAAFSLLEQIHLTGPHMSKQALRNQVADLASQVDPDYFAFALISFGTRKDLFELAAWTALESGKPSINQRRYVYRKLLRAGATPESIIQKWARRHNRDPERIQMIIVKPRCE